MSAPPTKRKTPRDATEFEREQLRDLLSADADLGATLAEINPSLAWLPVLDEMKLIRSAKELTPWVQKNFGEYDAVREVASNIRFFTPEAAEILGNALNRQKDTLAPLLLRCWRLIVHSLRERKHGTFLEWFELAPRIKGKDYSREVIDRLADLLRPKLTIRGRPPWYPDADTSDPVRPADLMSLDYAVDEHMNEREVLTAWSDDAPAEDDARLITALMDALERALSDATEAGVEGEGLYSISDSDVPSVAAHPQNEYHDGFLVIVRVIADLWTRLAAKNPRGAREFVNHWYRSDFKLVRRLALFAGENEVVPASTVVDMLMAVPLGELFLSGSSVEVYRLLRARWTDFSKDQQERIETRIAQGPPADCFREGADVDNAKDRSRYELLGDLQRRELELSAASTALLSEIQARHPEWSLREPDQAGFHVWFGGVHSVTGDPESLNGVADDELLDRAEALQSQDTFERSDIWAALCQTDPTRALRGLVATAAQEKWPTKAWRSFLWSAPKLTEPSETATVGSLVRQMPDEILNDISSVAAFWLNDRTKDIPDELLWSLWDRLFELTAAAPETNLTMRDIFTDALNAPSGRLAEVLLKKFVKPVSGAGLPDYILTRLEKLVRASGQFGMLARVRLAADVSFLFENAPTWTAQNILPLFSWSSPDAPAVWSARKYARYIGSPKLVGLLKQPFLELFARADAPEEDIRAYTDWLAAMLIASQSGAVRLPITQTEARSTLRKAGPKALSTFGHRLAVEMEGAADGDKTLKWQTIVGPVFRNVWPLDADLQTPASTFKLVQILMATGAAFPEAAETIIPFVRAEEPTANTTVFNISRAPEIVYQSSPDKLLDLLDAVVGDSQPRSVYALNEALNRLKGIKPEIASTRKFQHLTNAASVY